jgi:hypothetical protein
VLAPHEVCTAFEHVIAGVDTRGVVAGVDQGFEIATRAAADVEDPAAGGEGDGEKAGGNAWSRGVSPGELGGVSAVELDGARVHAGIARLALGVRSRYETGVSYKGTVRNGVVVLPPEAQLPEGAQVESKCKGALQQFKLQSKLLSKSLTPNAALLRAANSTGRNWILKAGLTRCNFAPR